MQFYIETDRLIIRDILPEDDEGILMLDADPEVHRYLGNQPINDIKQARDVIEFIRKQYHENGIGRWAMVEKSSNDFIGWTGLKLVKTSVNNHVDFYDLGYRLIRKYWGKGYATESALASLRYGFNELHLERIYAITDIRNQASKNVLQKVGFEQLESFDLDGIPHYWFECRKR